MENKKIMFCECKRSKSNIEFHQNFAASCKKSVEVLDELQDTEYQKVKREISCGKNYSINTMLNLKTRLV